MYRTSAHLLSKFSRIATPACAAVAALLVSAASASAQYVPPPGSPPPAYSPVRWNENYEYLKDPAKSNDYLDSIKYIPLTDDVYLSLGGQARFRYEYFHNNAFGAPGQDPTGFYLTRLMAHADLHVGPYFRAFVQGISAMEDNREPTERPQDANELDIHQAFVDGRIPLGEKDSLTLRFGRQNLIEGAQRLISPLDWTNTRRTFEGGKATLVLGNHTIDAFMVRPVAVEKEQVDYGDGDINFSGIYDTIALPDLIKGAGVKLEVYGLLLNQNARAANTRQVPNLGAIGADTDTYTIGARFSGNPKPFDFDVEADYQFGQAGKGDISAWSVAAEVGYTIADVPMTPRLYLGFDAASGDNDPTNPDKQTFNQLFPLGHAYFGFIDVVGRQNILDLHPGVEIVVLENKKMAKKIGLRADYHLFWRQSTDDALYNAAGGVQRAASGNSESYVGSELDLLMTWQIDKHFNAYVGYSHFFAGDFVEQTGPGKDIDFFYAALQYTF